MSTHNLVAQALITILLGSGALGLIKHGIIGPYERLRTYDAYDVLAGCIVLFLLFLMWW